MSALTNAYIFLILAIIAEVIGTLYLRETEGFTKIAPSIITAISYAASFYWLSFTLDEIPVGVAYATWSGVGIFLITFLAAIKYLQLPNLLTSVGMIFVISGVVLINLFSSETRGLTTLHLSFHFSKKIYFFCVLYF